METGAGTRTGARMVLCDDAGGRGQRPSRTRWTQWAAVVLMAAASLTDAEAQGPLTGSVRGTVRESGGVVPGVTVVLLDEETKASREVVANGVGEYSFTDLPPGTYTIRAALAGFRVFEQRGLGLDAQQVRTLDIELQVGGLEEVVVVTAGGFEQKIAEAPASISVISQEVLRARQYDNLAEALTAIEGVDVRQNTGKTGGLEISIRGMPSAYTLYLIDGRRQNNLSDVTPNGFSDTANNFIPPLSAIERIEVIRGPMSSLYGSDAVGGVVNIITKRTPDIWSASLELDHLAQQRQGYGGSTNASLYGAGPLIDGRLGLAVRGRVLSRGASNLQFADGSTVSRRGVAAVEGDNTNWGTRFTLTPNEVHEIAFDIEQGRQTYNNDDCQLGTLDGWSGTEWDGCLAVSTQASGYNDELRFNRDQIAVSHRANLSVGFWESALTYKETTTIGRTVPGTLGVAWGSSFPGVVGGAPRMLESTDIIVDTKLIVPVHRRHTLTLGAQYLGAEGKDGLATAVFQQRSLAAFGEDTWRILDGLRLTFGGRYEHHQAFGGHVNPRGYLTWTASNRWTVKGGIGRGYRVPTVNQLHDGINGAILQGTFLTIGSPDLKPETSTNYEVGFYFDSLAGFNANLTVFHTDFSDMIGVGVPIPNCWSATAPNLPGCLDFGSGFTQENFAQSINVDSAMSQGAELSARWLFAPRWSVSGNYTYTNTEQKSGVDHGMPITPQPRNIVNTSLDWDATARLQVWLRSEHFDSRPRFPNRYENLTPADRAAVDGLGRLKGYNQFRLGGTYRIGSNVTVNASVYNLFDQDFLECGSYVTNTGATACGPRFFQLGRVPAGHTTFWGTNQDRRSFWLSISTDF